MADSSDRKENNNKLFWKESAQKKTNRDEGFSKDIDTSQHEELLTDQICGKKKQ